MLVVPITSGKTYFNNCYHPVNNPYANKKYRQGLLSEGFPKDCVLKIDDSKFLSSGRVIRETVDIPDCLLKEIQFQVFQVALPTYFQKFNSQEKKVVALEDKIEYLKSEISSLKSENNRMKQILNNIKNKEE